MAKFLFPVPQWFTNAGLINAGGLIYTYQAGTTTPLATFTDSTGGTPNANPVVLDGSGRGQMWLSAQSYKFVVQTSTGAAIMTIDGYNPDTLNTTVSALTDTGDLTLQQSTAATSGANQSSNNVKIQASYWNGSASAVDQWNIQDVLGAGSNPTSTLQITHSGSSGAAAVRIGQQVQTIDGTASIPSLGFTSETNTGWFKQAAGVIGGAIAGVCRFLLNATGIVLGSGGAVGYSSNADPSAAGGDTFLNRQSAGVVGVGTTASAKDGTFDASKFIGSSTSGHSNSAVQASAAGTTGFAWNNTNGAADQKWADVTLSTTTWLLRFVNDANSVGSTIMQVTRGALSAVSNIVFGAGGGAQTMFTSTDTVAGKATTDIFSNKTLTGASSGNSVNLLNEQGPAAEINGTGAAVTVYTYTLPANVMQAGKGIKIRYWANHSTGAGAQTHQITFGGTAYVSNTDSGSTGQVYLEAVIFNNSGVTNAQHGSSYTTYPGATIPTLTFTGLTSAIATTSNVTITATFNSAAGTKLTPGQFIVELIQ